MYKYSELIKLSTNYATKMNKLSNRIFGEVTRQTSKKSMKVVKIMSERPVNKNPFYTVEYYPRHVETGLLMQNLRNYGLFRDEHQDFKEEMKRMRELRGKIRFSKNIDGPLKKDDVKSTK
uniref:Small ribosomal subunit protein mS33 n=1 Tax=Clastoptera arizonana TaxID=38151 RepID=A0A1B6DAT2_9HEMI